VVAASHGDGGILLAADKKNGGHCSTFPPLFAQSFYLLGLKWSWDPTK